MTVRRRTGVSLVATVCGWVAGGLWFSTYAWLIWGDLADVGIVVAWTTPFVLASWVVFFWPLVLLIDETNRLFRFPEFSFVGGAVGIIAFMLLIGWWAPLWRESYAYLAYPAISGAVAGTVYSLILQAKTGRLGR
jgi:hypothetical protein